MSSACLWRLVAIRSATQNRSSGFVRVSSLPKRHKCINFNKKNTFNFRNQPTSLLYPDWTKDCHHEVHLTKSSYRSSFSTFLQDLKTLLPAKSIFRWMSEWQYVILMRCTSPMSNSDRGWNFDQQKKEKYSKTSLHGLLSSQPIGRECHRCRLIVAVVAAVGIVVGDVVDDVLDALIWEPPCPSVLLPSSRQMHNVVSVIAWTMYIVANSGWLALRARGGASTKVNFQL